MLKRGYFIKFLGNINPHKGVTPGLFLNRPRVRPGRGGCHLKDNHVVLVFLRAPEPGRVKTRLAREIGAEKALALYKGFVQRILQAVALSGLDHRICFFPGDKASLVHNWLGPDHVYMPQKGADLGRRMGHALARVFDQGAHKAVVVGSDIPGLTPGHLTMAFDRLSHKDVVIGPSLDGGYWLIGFQRDRFCPDLFEGVEWGTPTVFSTTLELCHTHGLSPGILPLLQDIDTLQDLLAFQKERPEGSGKNPSDLTSWESII